MRLKALLLMLLAPAVTAFELPPQWVHGRAGEPALQVQEAAPDTWILRQSKTTHFEAPFLYLLAGTGRALLLDTGAEPERGPTLKLRETIDGLLRTARGVDDFPLVVAHTHAHGDHRGGDAQFADRPNTQVIAADPASVAAFFGLARWPEGEAAFDLGERELNVLPLPGHEPAHIAVYDPGTRSIFSGDSLYPGLITIRDLVAFRASIERLLRFAEAQAVERFLGAHIEMSATPGKLYPLGSRVQADEHALPLGLDALRQMHATLAVAGDFRRDEPRSDFVLTQVLPPPTDPPSIHGMLLFGHDSLWVSHLPMFHTPHDYQAIARVTLSGSAARTLQEDQAAHADTYYTFAPNARWVLPATFKADAHLRGDLYRGHFERGGTLLLRNIEVRVGELVHMRRFEPADQGEHSGWIAFGEGAEQFLAHRIGTAPDFDQLLMVHGASATAPVRMKGPAAPLAVGDPIGAATVERVIYLEFDDLRGQ